jgi:hypothetical protein
MVVDPYTARLAKVRSRFVSTLEGKIEDTYAALPKLSGDGVEIEAIDEAYRRIHGICGIRVAVGFPATSRAAKAVEDVLLAPVRARRGLMSNEVVPFKKALHAIRETAQQELRSFYMGLR